MSSFSSDALALLRDTLSYLQNQADFPIFASQETADYFRKKQETVKTASKNKEVIKVPNEPEIKQSEEKAILQLPIEAVKIVPSIPEKKPVSVEMPPPKWEERKTEPVLPAVPGAPKDSQPFRTSLIPLTEVRKLFTSLFPQFPVMDSIPNDAIAVKIAERWKTKNKTAPISILAFQEPPEQRALLEQIAKALDATFLSARLIEAEPIEKEKQWEAFLSVPDLKIVIICDYTLWQMKHLMTFFKENPTQGNRTLGTIPLFLLPDLSLYLKDPLLKRSLWKALCQKISS